MWKHVPAEFRRRALPYLPVNRLRRQLFRLRLARARRQNPFRFAWADRRLPKARLVPGSTNIGSGDWIPRRGRNPRIGASSTNARDTWWDKFRAYREIHRDIHLRFRSPSSLAIRVHTIDRG